MKKLILFLLVIAFAMPHESFARRCAAITKQGTQCSRNASGKSIYCKQHIKVQAKHCHAQTKAGKQCSRIAKDGTIYCRQHQKLTNVKIFNPNGNKTKATKARQKRQCIAITKQHKQCSRNAVGNTNFCKQHNQLRTRK